MPLPPVTLQGTYFRQDGRLFIPVGAHWVPAEAALQWPYQWDPASIQADFVVPTDTNWIQISLAANSGGQSGGTNMVWLWNWNQQRYVLIGAVPLARSGNATRTITVRQSEVPDYIDSSGNVQALVRGHLPIRFNHQMPNPFRYQIDLLQLGIRESPGGP